MIYIAGPLPIFGVEASIFSILYYLLSIVYNLYIYNNIIHNIIIYNR